MGLQILSADIPPPTLIRGDSAPQLSARDDTRTFDGYLNDARAAVETEPATQSSEGPHSDAEPSTDVDEIDDDAAPSADHAEETTDHQSTVAATPSVAIGSDASNRTPNPVESPAESSSFPQQQPTAITPSSFAETTEPRSSQPVPTDSSQQTQTLPQQANLSSQDVEQLANQDTRPTPTSENAAQSGRTATKTLPDQLTPVRELPDGPWQQSQKTHNQPPVQSLATDQSRAREEAVELNRPPSIPRLAATQRGALASPPPNPQQPPNPRLAATRREVLDSPPTIPVPKPIALKTGKGDPAAAAFAKFLISAADQGGAGSPTNAAAPTSAGAIGQVAGGAASTAVANQAPVADLVADLLAARVEDADAIKGAARVLNASGRSGKFEVTMRLDPPELGQLRVQIQMRQQGLTLRVDAQTQAVAKMIESRLTELSDALALHGIRVDRAEVTVRSAGSAQTDAQPQQDNGPANHGEFNQASNQDQDGRDQGEAGSQQTADQHLSDPKHPVEELEGGPYQNDPTAPAGLGAKTNDAVTPATELSVDLVA